MPKTTFNLSEDREALTAERAFNILWNGGAVRINNPLNDYPIFITDIISIDELDKQTKEKSEKQVYEYLRSYEIWKQ